MERNLEVMKASVELGLSVSGTVALDRCMPPDHYIKKERPYQDSLSCLPPVTPLPLMNTMPRWALSVQHLLHGSAGRLPAVLTSAIQR